MFTTLQTFQCSALLAIGLAALMPATGALAQSAYTITDLGSSVIPYAINETGQVAGDNQQGGSNSAFLYSGGVMNNFLGSTYSVAYGLNNLGHVVGFFDPGNNDGLPVPFVYDGTTATNLVPGILSTGEAHGINDSGQIVGWSEALDGKAHLTLWDDGQIIDLNQFIPADLVAAGWHINDDPLAESSIWTSDFLDINNRGVIISTLYNGDNALPLMLTPVPVPAAVWLFGSGLAGLVGVARRRMKTTI